MLKKAKAKARKQSELPSVRFEHCQLFAIGTRIYKIVWGTDILKCSDYLELRMHHAPPNTSNQSWQINQHIHKSLLNYILTSREHVSNSHDDCALATLRTTYMTWLACPTTD